MKTNLLKTGATPDLCPPVTPIECGTEGEIFNSSTLSNSVRVCLAAGEVAQLTAFKLAAGNTIKVFIDAKGNGVECADCGPDDRVPLMDCDGCHQNQLNEFKRQTYVVGPNCFVFVSDAPVGEPFVTMTKVHLDQVPSEFICQEPCYPPVTATVSICPVPNCFTWRGKKYLNLADFVADVQTIVTGATYDAATCTFSAPAGSTFPDLTIAACIPCPPLTITATSSGMTSAIVTVTGGAATVSVSGDCCADQEGVGPFTFTGLTAGTRYIFTAVSKCGTPSNTECDGCEQATASTELTTDACPALVLTAAATGTNSIAVTVVSGGSAWVELNGEKRYLANSETTTFNDLTPAKEYFAIGTSDCGSIANVSATTQACPAISLTQTSNTTGSITVTLVSGGTASVFVSGDEAILANGASYTFTNLTAGKNYTAKVISECGNKANFTLATAPCPAVDFTTLALSTTSLQVTAVAGTPLDVSIVSQGGAVLDAIDGLTSTIVFADLPEGAIVTVKAVNECGKKKQVNVNLPDPVVVPVPCPSFSLADQSPYFKGFAYVAGDLVDPAATVPYRGGFIYPTAGEGHTVKVTDIDGVTVIGYAVNKSDCANPCCTPVINRINVSGDIIDDSTNNYYVEGEVNKCDGTPVQPTDKLFNVGSLMKCVDGEAVPLECGDIVVTKTDCDEVICQTAVRMTNPTALVGAGVCVDVQAVGYDSFGLGVAVLRGRDLASEVGVVANGGGSGAHLQYTHTNDTTCPQLLEARLVGNGNVAYWGAGAKVSFVYNIGPVLNITMPGTSSNPLLPNFATMRQTITAMAPNTLGGVPGISSYQEETVTGARHIQVLQPGETLTLYAQWWAVLYASNPMPGLIPIHGHMGMDITVYENGAYL